MPARSRPAVFGFQIIRQQIERHRDLDRWQLRFPSEQRPAAIRQCVSTRRCFLPFRTESDLRKQCLRASVAKPASWGNRREYRAAPADFSPHPSRHMKRNFPFAITTPTDWPSSASSSSRNCTCEQAGFAPSPASGFAMFRPAAAATISRPLIGTLSPGPLYRLPCACCPLRRCQAATTGVAFVIGDTLAVIPIPFT